MPDIFFYKKNKARYIFNEIVKKFNKKEIFYRSNKNVMNGDIEIMRKDMIKYYRNNLINFTEEEKELIISIIHNIIKKFENRFPLVSKWRFVLLTNEPDNNLSYTLIDTIILHKFPRNFREPQYQRYLEKIIFHEQIHILQRYNQKVFNEFYRNKWGFIKTNLKNKWLADNRITNPDNNDSIYIKQLKEYPTYITYVITEIIITNNNNLEQIGVFLIYIKNKGFKFLYNKNNSLMTKKLNEITEITNLFNGLQNKYSPNEIFCHSVCDMIYENKTFSFINHNDLLELNNKFN